MSCNIRSYAEVRKNGVWEQSDGVHPFDDQNCGVYGFLANVRNYAHAPCIQEPTYLLPDDVSDSIRDQEYYEGGHSYSHLTLRQLAEYDYDQVFWNRRVTKQLGPNLWSGAALAEEGEGEHPVLREFLGQSFFNDLEMLKTLGSLDDVRVVFWFDC